MTLQEFSGIFALLAVQLRATDADEATIRGYYRALKDLEPEFLAMAAERLADGADWFPKTSEWRKAARQVERDRYDELRARIQKLSSPLCNACEDTGWCKVNPESNRFRVCDCATLRRLEVLGRRPMPGLPAAPEDWPEVSDGDVTALVKRAKAS